MFKHNEQTKNRSWLKIASFLLPILIVFLAGSFYAVYSWYNSNLEPVTTEQVEDVVVIIERGSSVQEIAEQMQTLGVIRSSTVFRWYVDRSGERENLQAGTYQLNPAMSVEEIVQKLVDGDVATNLFTVLPGKRLDEIEQDFIDFGFSEAEVSAALNAKYDHPLFAETPKNATLEGYIFPETYQITADDTPATILQHAFDEFDSLLTDEIRAGLKKQGLTLHEAIILSSIVELESANVEDQRKIAQVFLKRLDEGISLGSDPTFFYAAAVTGEEATPDLDHPYNTRIYKGLPPGPISNFNLSAIEAVANPANTEWLYFVAGDDGNTYFSKTEEEHLRLVEQHCIELCRLP